MEVEGGWGGEGTPPRPATPAASCGRAGASGPRSTAPCGALCTAARRAAAAGGPWARARTSKCAHDAPFSLPHPALSLHPFRAQGYTLKLATDKVIGNGSFGVVFEAKVVETGETVAIKKVLQDKRFKVRDDALVTLSRGERSVSREAQPRARRRWPAGRPRRAQRRCDNAPAPARASCVA
jgi:hypothetical protein